LGLGADRDPFGNGRTYTITVTCRDASGNVATSATTVRVPKSQGHPGHGGRDEHDDRGGRR
jgi:hypothetical protein